MLRPEQHSGLRVATRPRENRFEKSHAEPQKMDRNTMMMVAIGALILAVLYLYRENQKLRVPAPASVPEPAAKKIEEKSVPVESE